MRPLVILLAGLTALLGCAGNDDADRCDAARAHLERCLGVKVPAGACDASAAEATLAQDCASLVDPGKADLFGSALCSLGVLSACDVPACPSAPPATCADAITRDDCTQCDYYRCREAEAACGSDGYYLGFGYAYCLRYLEVTTPRLSAAGQRFLHDVRPCLMNVMEAEIPTTASCADVAQAGFASHPRCYLMTGFCDLPLSDWLLILTT
ncbi:MAG: hypothetical protein NT062_37440, partial [Proteobacteria bacterium]|nr:hypothetical protein [Pseudomonadota bacterium]